MTSELFILCKQIKTKAFFFFLEDAKMMEIGNKFTSKHFLLLKTKLNLFKLSHHLQITPDLNLN